MKKIIITLLCVSTCLLAHSQVDFEPMIGIGIYTSRSQGIISTSTNELINYPMPGSSGYSYEESPRLKLQLIPKIDYEITTGFRLKYQKFVFESENLIRIATDDFVRNMPYSAEFYLRIYYRYKRVKIGCEHLCIHPIQTENTGLLYNIRGGHTKLYLSYNM